jgi:hypothetical protein
VDAYAVADASPRRHANSPTNRCARAHRNAEAAARRRWYEPDANEDSDDWPSDRHADDYADANHHSHADPYSDANQDAGAAQEHANAAAGSALAKSQAAWS